MAIEKIQLPEPGQRVGVVYGPGEFANDNAGTVMCHITNRWGTHALVMMDSGQTKTCHGMKSGPGVGWHAI